MIQLCGSALLAVRPSSGGIAAACPAATPLATRAYVGVLRRELMAVAAARLAAHRVSAVRNAVQHVVDLRSPGEIDGPVIQRIAIQVARYLAGQSRPVECLADKPVHEESPACRAVSLVEDHPPVADIRINRHTQDAAASAPGRHVRAHAPLIRHCVTTLIPRNGQPAFASITHVDSSVVGRAPGLFTQARGSFTNIVMVGGAPFLKTSGSSCS
jgi:hypothetical protein